MNLFFPVIQASFKVWHKKHNCPLKWSVDSARKVLITPPLNSSDSPRVVNLNTKSFMRNNIFVFRRTEPALNPLTPEEKRQIVKAIGLSKGHWFKCPRGHVYAIGECGGAMETSKCPECKAVIGGTSHKLVEGNQLASEMDNARYPAWSEQANLANYENLDEIV